jgi:hypothetical protein
LGLLFGTILLFHATYSTYPLLLFVSEFTLPLNSFTQMTKDGSNYGFRWEDQDNTGHMMPPFLQVVIRTDGEILQYMNTLDIWTK